MASNLITSSLCSDKRLSFVIKSCFNETVTSWQRPALSSQVNLIARYIELIKKNIGHDDHDDHDVRDNEAAWRPRREGSKQKSGFEQQLKMFCPVKNLSHLYI